MFINIIYIFLVNEYFCFDYCRDLKGNGIIIFDFIWWMSGINWKEKKKKFRLI